MVRVLTDKEIEEQYGIASDELDHMGNDVACGVFHGKPRGTVTRGRPLKFGEQTRQVGFKEPLAKIEAIDRRAAQLGMKRSDYLRHLVDEDLRLAGAL